MEPQDGVATMMKRPAGQGAALAVFHPDVPQVFGSSDLVNNASVSDLGFLRWQEATSDNNLEKTEPRWRSDLTRTRDATALQGMPALQRIPA